MVSFGEAIKEQGRIILCNLLGGPESVPYLGGSVSDDANALQKSINGARRYVCNDSDSITEPEVVSLLPGSPISGGQCPGAGYSLSFKYDSVIWETLDCTTTVDFIGLTDTRTGLVGPITNPRVEFEGNGECGPSRAFWRVDDANGVVTLVAGSPQQTGRVASLHRLYDLVATRTDGGSEDCGDFDPGPNIYSPTTITVNIDYEDNTQTTINEDVDITIFAPIAIVGGAIIAPITVTGNDFSLVGNLELTPEFNLTLSPEVVIGRPGNPDDQPPDGIDQPELPEPNNGRRVIVGAIVTATGIGVTKAGSIPQGVNPDIWIPRLGSVSFYITTDKGNGWTTDINIKNTRSYIPCPVASGAVDVAGTGASGITLDVEPVWAHPLQSQL